MDERFAAASTSLRHALTQFLDEQGFSATHPLGADLRHLLSAPGKLLSSTAASSRVPQGFWALLPLMIARYCLPSAEPALLLRVGVSCELLLCALDYYDELQDDDDSPERRLLGDGRLLNAAYTLSVLSRRALATLPPALIAPAASDRLLDAVDEELLVAVSGQHQDLLAEAREEVTLEECLATDMAKAGALLRLTCRLAAMAVDAPSQISAAFARIGENVGTAFQIENDAHDLEMQLSDAAESGKSDLLRHKKTLPILYATRQLVALQESPSPADREKQVLPDTALLSRAYNDGIAAAIGCAVYLRNEAKAQVPLIEACLQRPLPQELSILFGIDVLG